MTSKLLKFLLTHKLLLAIFLIGIFFRFYRVTDFQFWSTDEELIAHFAKKIVTEHKIFLISPNYTIGASLGSAFHMFTGFLYALTGLDPIKQQALGSVLGVVNIGFFYLIGKEFKSKTVGYIAAFLYAASLLMSLYDRRWWTLTVGPFFTGLAVWSTIKVIKGHYFFSSLLAVSVAMAWQIDPNLGILPIGALLCWIFFKIPLFKKEYLPALGIIVLSFIPLIFFEVRHPGALTAPLMKQVVEKSAISSGDLPARIPIDWIKTIARFPHVYGQYLFMSPTGDLDANFNWIQEVQPWFSPLPELLIGVVFTVSMYSIVIQTFVKKRVLISEMCVFIYFLTFVVSLIIFALLFSRNLGQHYFQVSIPLFILLFAYGTSLFLAKHRVIVITFLLLFLGLNLKSLFLSAYTYPLRDKKTLVQEVIKEVGNRPYSVYTRNHESFSNNGFTGLLVLQNSIPTKSSDYTPLDWWFRSQSLYFSEPTSEDPDTIVIFNSKGLVTHYPEEMVTHTIVRGNIEALMLDNQTRWFDPQKVY